MERIGEELSEPEITLSPGKYEINGEAMKRIKAATNEEFEKEIQKFPENIQWFLRMARDHN